MSGEKVFFDWIVPGICGTGLHFRLDGFRLVYTCIAVLMWAVSGVFSLEYMSRYRNRGRYYGFFWATFAATLGVFWSADLLTTFLFFEIMSFTSYVWVAFDEREASLRAAETYLAVAVIGGMVMLMGLFLLYDLLGTLEMDAIGPLAGRVLSGEGLPRGAGAAASRGICGGIFPSQRAQLYTASALLLFGFGAKAGCFPLHIWLPKAHPEAPAPASALLSGILTKTGVFGIIVVSCGMFGSDRVWGLLIAVLGLVTMFTGALLAVFSINLKRTLACSTVSQIGFILTGIGMACLLRSAGEGNALAVRGAFLHMVNHSLFKLVLFLCAGAVYMNLHRLELDDIRGFGRKKPALLFAFLMGALGIGGIPLWNGYISKTLIHESIAEYLECTGGSLFWHAAEWLFLFTGGMTVSYMLKLFVALFVERHPTRQAEFDAMGWGRWRGPGKSGGGEPGSPSKPYMNAASTAVLTGTAVLFPILGMAPHRTMDRIADLGEGFFHVKGAVRAVEYFSFANLKGSLISIAIGVLLYVFVIRGLLMEKGEGGRHYVNRWPAWLDLENLVYRPLLQVILPSVFGAACGAADRLVTAALDGICALPSVFGTVFGYAERLTAAVLRAVLAAGTLFGRLLDSAVDAFVRLLRLTTHRQAAPPREVHDTNLAAHLLGSVIDACRGNRGGSAESASVALVRRQERLKHILRLVETSFSFGLMLFCIGLCLTLGYLLYMFFGR